VQGRESVRGGVGGLGISLRTTGRGRWDQGGSWRWVDVGLEMDIWI